MKLTSNKLKQIIREEISRALKEADVISRRGPLSKEEKHHLYYGYIFQDGYSPYGSSDYSDSINYVMNLDPDSNDVFQKMITYSDSVLAKFPFSINALKYQSIAYMNLGDKKNEEILMNKVDVIFTALFNSGDGITKESCFYVINAHHEYEMLYILGFDFGGEQKLIEHYDYLKLAKNEQGIEGFYFDITPCLNNLNEMMKE